MIDVFTHNPEAQTMRALFTDFDGVLHDADAVKLDFSTGELQAGPGAFALLPMLASLMAPYPDVRIVVSSSWRRHFTLSELRELLGPLGSRVIATTLPPSGSFVEPTANRFEECAACARQLKISDWRMLDDSERAVWGLMTPTPEQSTRLILCAANLGIATPSVAQQLLAWLQMG